MSQYDFGTIDPYVVDGVQLAGMLNQWRDAIHSWHRGAARPSYAVPGMMWVNDSAGAANWIVNVFMGATVGDVPLFTYDTTTGQISIAAGSGGFTANLITALGTTPTMAFNKTDNPIDQKRWRWTVDAAGALVLSSLNDAGAVVSSFTFNRDGSTNTIGWRRLGRIVPVAAQATVDFQNIAADINELDFTFDVTPTGNATDFGLQFYDNAGVIDQTAGHYIGSLSFSYHTIPTNNAPLSIGQGTLGISQVILLNYSGASRRVGNTNGIRGRGRIPNIRANRVKGVDWQSNYLSDDATLWMDLVGSGKRYFVGAITGFRLWFTSTTFAAGGSVTLWGSP